MLNDDLKGKRKHYSDSEDEVPIKKRSHVLEKLDIIESKLSKIFEVKSHLPMPLGLSSLILDAFRCKQSPMIPPAIFARCCKRIVGCKKCVDQWYKGEDGLVKKCPMCRGDREFADTSKVLGIDEFLVGVGGIHMRSLTWETIDCFCFCFH